MCELHSHQQDNSYSEELYILQEVMVPSQHAAPGSNGHLFTAGHHVPCAAITFGRPVEYLSFQCSQAKLTTRLNSWESNGFATTS